MDDAPETAGAHTGLVTQLRKRGYRTSVAGEVLLAVGLAWPGGPRRVTEIVRTPRPSDLDRPWWRIRNGNWLAESDNPIQAAIAFTEHLHPVQPPGARQDPGTSIHA